MSKFKIKLKLQGLELEVEGEREDIPLLTKAVSAQIAGQLMPATGIAEGKLPALLGRDPISGTATVVVQPSTATRTSRKRRAASGGSDSTQKGPATAVIWQHDANTWGYPLQIWKAVDKTVWLLYVAKQIGAADEMTVMQMVITFDKLFRTAGKLNNGNVARDFAKLNSEPPAKVQMNGTVDPATWYLTDAGIKYAENLVNAARGEPAVQE